MMNGDVKTENMAMADDESDTHNSSAYVKDDVRYSDQSPTDCVITDGIVPDRLHYKMRIP